MDERRQELADQQGTAYHDALQQLIDTDAHVGGMQEVQDVIVAFAVTDATGMYVQNAETDLAWKEPDNANAHLIIAVMDAADNRFLPYLDIDATVFSPEDEQEFDVPFVWHPYMFHYGRNVEIPENTPIDIRIHVDTPTFDRHDRRQGDRYTSPVEVVFENIETIS